MPRYEHSGAAVATTIPSAITSTATSIVIASASGWPTGGTGPFWATIDRGTASEEKILVTSRAGTTLTVSTRGADGTTATGHATNAPIEHTLSATELDEASAAAARAQAVTGALVGTTDTQTLTGKTVALGSNTVSGTKAQFDAACTDADFASLDGAETLTNKTLTSPVLNSPSGVPRGKVAYAETTVQATNIIGASATVLQVTLTTVAGRRYRLSAHAGLQQNATAASLNELQIREGATVLTRDYATGTASLYRQANPVVIIAPAAGAHTYTVYVSSTAGAVDFNASADDPAFLLVEDIGT